jgi:sterol desaturase/sphingolipid hydroxylase (fatty acid hydroxylase superfamily)
MLDSPLSEPQIRLLAFASIFGVLALVEIFAPRLQREEMRGALKSKRWFTNLSMVVLSSLLLRVVFPLAAVGTAQWASTQGYGLLPYFDMPLLLSCVIAFIALDLAVWFEHLMSHKIGLLWRIHRMHHADTGFDLTTALRFHPLEIILSMVWKAVIIIALGAPAIAVLVFEIVLNGAAMFNHANIKLPLPFDRILRKIIVTPDMHRVHHSVVLGETNSNYGFNLSVWDHLFGTYIDQPKAGHEQVKIGLEDWRDEKPAQLLWALKIPFITK